jgi:hypothetical protein
MEPSRVAQRINGSVDFDGQPAFASSLAFFNRPGTTLMLTNNVLSIMGYSLSASLAKWANTVFRTSLYAHRLTTSAYSYNRKTVPVNLAKDYSRDIDAALPRQTASYPAPRHSPFLQVQK